MNRIAVAGAAAGALLTGGCVDTVGSLQTRPPVATAEAPNAPAAGSQAPSQLSPFATYSTGGEEIVTAYVPPLGQVRGTRAALATLGSPLPAAPGRNRTVEACRAMTEAEAMKLGAKDVEAASAGPDRPNAKGQFVGPVRMRITYARPNGYEVRLADMTCVVDRNGKIVDAHV